MSEKGKVIAEIKPKEFISFFNLPKKERVPKNVDGLINIVETIILDKGLRNHLSKQKIFQGESKKDIRPGNFVDISIVEEDEEGEQEMNTYRFKIIRYENDDLKLVIFDAEAPEEEEEEYYGDDIYQAIKEIELEEKVKTQKKGVKGKSKRAEEEEVIVEEEEKEKEKDNEEVERKRQIALQKYLKRKEDKPQEEELVIEKFKMKERGSRPLVTENERFIEDLPWIRCLSCGKVIAKTWEEIRLLVQNYGLILTLLRAIKRKGNDLGTEYDQFIFKLGKEMGIYKGTSEADVRGRILEAITSRYDLDFIGKLDLNDEDLMGKLMDHYGINRMCCRTYMLFPSKISTATTSENVKTEELLLRNKKEESLEEERTTQDILKKVGLLRNKKKESSLQGPDSDKPSKKTIFGKKAI